MTANRHLSEAERHDAADGSTPPERSAGVHDHLRQCESCAADVARVRQVMTRAREAPAPLNSGPDLWPEIRSRIERDKIISLPGPDRPIPAPSRSRRTVRWIAGALAAATIVVIVSPPGRGGSKSATPQPAAGAATELSLAADSARAYQREAQYLLNDLEMRRAMMRPQTAVSIDRDLQIIDKAIAEVEDAIAHDPNNPALRRLLASSYKQKVELLKRAVNAG